MKRKDSIKFMKTSKNKTVLRRGKPGGSAGRKREIKPDFKGLSPL
jgi:hypothetical protein